MTEQQVFPSSYYPYLLVASWPMAWEKYRGRVADIGALPGLLLAGEAQILKREDAEIVGSKYWASPLRSDINLALRISEREGWLARVDLTWENVSVDPRLHIHYTGQLAEKVYRICDEFGWLFDGFSLHSTEQRLKENPNSPDLKWWIQTVRGQKALAEKTNEIKWAQEEHKQRLRRLGFV